MVIPASRQAHCDKTLNFVTCTKNQVSSPLGHVGKMVQWKESPRFHPFVLLPYLSLYTSSGVVLECAVKTLEWQTFPLSWLFFKGICVIKSMPILLFCKACATSSTPATNTSCPFLASHASHCLNSTVCLHVSLARSPLFSLTPTPPSLPSYCLLVKKKNRWSHLFCRSC